MMKDKCKNIINRSQHNLAPLDTSSPTTASSRYPNTVEEPDSDLKSHLMKMIETLKEDINNSLKKTQENTVKQVETLKEEINKSHKEIQENTIKWVKEI
jgi:phosphate uptake regulator